jgi:hypothetical protein
VNRAEMTRRVLLLEAAAAELKTRAATIRADLGASARTEHAEQGTAPTWRLQDIGTWTLPVSKEAVYVADEAALLEWVKAEPARLDEVVETIERVKPWYVAELLRLVRIVEEQVIDDDGTIVPGLAVRPGGVAQTLSFRADPLAKAVAADAAGKLVNDLAAGFGIEALDAAR